MRDLVEGGRRISTHRTSIHPVVVDVAISRVVQLLKNYSPCAIVALRFGQVNNAVLVPNYLFSSKFC